MLTPESQENARQLVESETGRLLSFRNALQLLLAQDYAAERGESPVTMEEENEAIATWTELYAEAFLTLFTEKLSVLRADILQGKKAQDLTPEERHEWQALLDAGLRHSIH